MLVTLLLELLSMAPTLVADVEGTVTALHGAPDAAAKATAIAAGIDHLATNVAPALKAVGQ